jgi:excisionase family DNA binding protein
MANTTTEVKPRYLGIREASVYSSLSGDTLRQMIADGRLPCFRPCKKVLVAVEDLDRAIRGPAAGGEGAADEG